jgi:hypothetical protein
MSNETKQDAREPEFWGSGDQERLTCTDPDEFVEEYLDAIDPSDWPEKLTIVGYVPMPGKLDPDRYLEQILEDLDEEYGDPDGDPFKETDSMRQAMKTCCDAILAEYEPWSCEPVCKMEIDVQAWIKENRPDWLTESRP